MSLVDYTLDQLTTERVPDLSEPRVRKAEYRRIRINETQRKYHEEFTEVTSYGIRGKNHYGVMKNPPIPHSIDQLFVRKSVMRSLLSVESYLAGHNLHLFVKDAWRPLALQQNRYEYNRNKLRSENPDWSDEDLDIYMAKWIASVPDTMDGVIASPPPHTTGGAVDVILMDHQGKTLPMDEEGQKKGGRNPDRMYPDFFEIEAVKRTLTPEEETCQVNRRILFHAMTISGFSYNPTEWWHYSLGDQLWGFTSGVVAIYGYIGCV